MKKLVRGRKAFCMFVLFIAMLSLCLQQVVCMAKLDEEHLVTEDLKTPTKSQGNSGACWAYACIATLETFLAQRKLFVKSLSEEHLLQWSYRGKNQFGWNIGKNDGGTSLAAIGYLASGAGPKYASNSFLSYDGEKKVCQNKEEPNIRVSGIKYIYNNTRCPAMMKDDVKQAILDYGAVASGYINQFCGHAISIVGWIDSCHSWIIKDSLTKSYRKQAYNTMGLLSCCANYAVSEVKERGKNEKIHQHDKFASIMDIGSNSSKKSADFANVFEFDGKEKLTSVMFKTECEGAKYKIFYAPTKEGTPDTNKKSWTLLSSGEVAYQGYMSSDTKQNFIPPRGKGAIVISIDNSVNKEKATIGCECDYLDLRVPQINGLSYFINEKTADDILSFDYIVNSKVSALSIKAITSSDSP